MKVLIRTDVTEQTGFGHFARTTYIAESIQQTLNEQNIEFNYCGTIAEQAKAFAENRLASVKWLNAKSIQTQFYAGIIDTMFDPLDMEYYSIDDIQNVANCCVYTLLISSSRLIPDKLPVDEVIGYILKEPKNPNYRVSSSLDYAPVSKEASCYKKLRTDIRNDNKNIFIAMGNWHDSTAIFSILDSFQNLSFSGEVNLLLPICHQCLLSEITKRYNDIKLEVHVNVRSVYPLIRKADLAIVSYGNLMFEALSIGTICAVVGLKPFQSEYARYLSEQGLVYYIGDQSEINSNTVEKCLNLNYDNRCEIYNKCTSRVDGQGIDRIAKKVIKHLK